MHYPATAFSINGQPTIVALQPLPPGVVMGQRNGLSQGDIDGINAMYPPPVTLKEIRKDPIKDTLKEIRKDPIKDTIKEIGKDPIKDTLKEIRKDPIKDTIKEIRKDPMTDTIKEVGRDPIQPGMPIRPGDYSASESVLPFVTEAPSRAPQAMADPLAEAAV